ncbi:MAG: hypothetical protein KBD63_00195 [Bacteriovoracaceae bacterium]|nr:hypothetical protein [Bacteriovoracaceae bacterium]
MRYYLINEKNEEIIIDLKRTTKRIRETLRFEFSSSDNDQQVYIRKLAGKYYASFDGIRWNKIAKQSLPEKILNVNQNFNLYRGFKPSGLSQAGAGEMVSQMPGKVIKILAKVGQEVVQGTPLLIIEAMKMENEIKAGADGKIKAIHVKEGQAIDSGFLMLEIT